MPDCSILEEKELLWKISQGDEPAFKKLFLLYKESFYRLALKMTRSEVVAEDMVQDVFMNLWNKRERLNDIETPSAYLFTMIYRRIYQHYRRVAQEKKHLELSASDRDFVNITEEAILANEMDKIIAVAIAKLPPQQQLVYRLSKLEGLSRDEIANQLAISPHTVKNHLTDAIRSIRKYLPEATFISLFIFITLEK